MVQFLLKSNNRLREKRKEIEILKRLFLSNTIMSDFHFLYSVFLDSLFFFIFIFGNCNFHLYILALYVVLCTDLCFGAL